MRNRLSRSRSSAWTARPAGDHFFVMDEKKARNIAEIRASRAKEEEQEKCPEGHPDNIFEKIKEGEMKELDVIIKADVQGSVEALVQSLQAIVSRGPHLHRSLRRRCDQRIRCHACSASNALINGWNVRPITYAMAEKDGVDVRLYRVIYDCIMMSRRRWQACSRRPSVKWSSAMRDPSGHPHTEGHRCWLLRAGR